MERRAYPSDVSDEEGALVAPSVPLMTEAAPQRRHVLREVFTGVRWLVGGGRATMGGSAARGARGIA